MNKKPVRIPKDFPIRPRDGNVMTDLLKPYAINECKPLSKNARQWKEARDYADRIQPAFILTPPTPKAAAEKPSKKLF